MTRSHLLVVALLTGVAPGVFSPSEMAAVRAVVPTEDCPPPCCRTRHASTSPASSAPRSADCSSPSPAVTRRLPFAVDAVSFAVSWVLLGRIRADLRPPAYDGPRRRVVHDLRQGVGFIARHPFFRVLTVWATLSNLVVNALFLAAILRLIQGGFDPVAIALVSTAAGACGILGALVAPWLIERTATGRLTALIAWSLVPLSIPTVLVNHPAVVAAALSVGIFLNPAGNAGIQSYRLPITPPELLGRVQSASQFVSMSAMPLAPVVAGLSLSLWGGPAATGAIAGLCVLVALVPTASRAVRSVPRVVDAHRQHAAVVVRRDLAPAADGACDHLGVGRDPDPDVVALGHPADPGLAEAQRVGGGQVAGPVAVAGGRRPGDHAQPHLTRQKLTGPTADPSQSF
jgi:hypothetical protein